MFLRNKVAIYQIAYLVMCQIYFHHNIEITSSSKLSVPKRVNIGCRAENYSHVYVNGRPIHV